MLRKINYFILSFLLVCKLFPSSAVLRWRLVWSDHVHDGRYSGNWNPEVQKGWGGLEGWKRRISVLLERSRAIAENYCLATKDRIDVASSDKSDYAATAAPEICLHASSWSQSLLIESLWKFNNSYNLTQCIKKKIISRFEL